MASQVDESKESDTGMLDTWIHSYEGWVRDDPNDTNARAHLALCYFWKGRNTNAEREFRECLRLDPKNPLVLRHHAIFQALSGDPSRAVATAQAALKATIAASQIPDAIWLVGYIQYLAGQDLEAIRTWNLVSDKRLSGESVFGLPFGLACVYMLTGQVRTSHLWFKKAAAAAAQLPGENNSFPIRWAGALAEMELAQLTSWPFDATTREVLEVLLRLSWGIGGPIEYRQLTSRLIELSLELIG